MNRFLAILFFILSMLIGWGVTRAQKDLSKFESFYRTTLATAGITLEGDTTQLYWRTSNKSLGNVHVLQCAPGSTAWGTLLFSRATGPRSWPEHTETILALRFTGFPDRQISLPFSLPTILTTLALLFLAAGVWLLWRDRKRRLGRRMAGA